MTLVVQFQTFFAMIAAGSAIALQLDVYHRCLLLRSKWTQAVMDLAFWIVQALLVFYLLFYMNFGELRIYIFIAIILGFVTYWHTVRPFFLRLLERIIQMVQWLIKVVKKTIYVLIITPILGLYKLISKIATFFLTIVRWSVIQLSKLLFFFIRPVYTILQGPKIVKRVKAMYSRMIRWFSKKSDDEDS
ncbi:hypothetical protein DH09_21660 [Bacillaceae bacterium JMAK1]|nr:hypothetical protein DH09_21660 [Bacillaceae bacterium JMAK1]